MEAKAPLQILTHDEFCVEKVPDPCGIVIFGASGDLTHRKLIPALFNLYRAKLLPKGFFVIGFARTPGRDEDYRKNILETLREKQAADPALQKEFAERIYYLSGDYTDKSSLESLGNLLGDLDARHGCRENAIFYLATPPPVYGHLLRGLAGAGLIHAPHASPWSRVVIEKPFGHDAESAERLNREIKGFLDESQVYRIDHYMGKETVQNVLIFRFANTVFEPVWNRQYIDHVQITAAETLGVEHRAGYYDKAGALRDMFQNHMLQLLALTAMEPPVRFDADSYRDEKVKLLKSIRRIPMARMEEYAVRGQYAAGAMDGRKVCGYREEEGIQAGSTAETFVALKLFIDNWRWQGVPFYLRSGKRLKERVTEISIQFKNVPHSMFSSLGVEVLPANVLCLRIQPGEGISLGFEAKHPGPKLCMATLHLEFNYQDVFKIDPPEAYERLLLDCMQGDQTLFVRQDMSDVSWAWVTTILDYWKKTPPPRFPNYEAGSWGPGEADTLIQRDGRAWRIR